MSTPRAGEHIEQDADTEVAPPAPGAPPSAPPPSHPAGYQRGDSVGRYLILGLLGEGAMGAVYSAYDPELNRKVALKLLRSQGQWGGPEAQRRLEREARALAKLSHPNVVHVYDVGTHRRPPARDAPAPSPAASAPEQRGAADAPAPGDDAPDVFVAMEYVEGVSLDVWQRQQPKPTWREILRVYCDACRGLAAAHASGIVHRDIKPSNLMLGDDGRARAVDFGLAAARSEASADHWPGPSREHDAPAAAAPAHSAHGSVRDDPNDSGDAALAAHASRPSAARDPKPPAQPHALGSRPDIANPDVDPADDERRYRAASLDETIPATTAEGFDDSDNQLTHPGTIMGTPAYMAPEQHLGSEVGPAADQFSFCVALYEALYGVNPYLGATIDERRDKIEGHELTPPPVPSDVPSWLHRVIVRGLRRHPEDRWPSLEALLQALDSDPETDQDPDATIRSARRFLVGGTIAFALVAVSAWFAQGHIALIPSFTSPGGALLTSLLFSAACLATFVAGHRALIATPVSRQFVALATSLSVGMVLVRLIPLFYDVPFEYGFLYIQVVIVCVSGLGGALVLRPLYWIAALWLLILALTMWHIEYAVTFRSVGALVTCALGLYYWLRR